MAEARFFEQISEEEQKKRDELIKSITESPPKTIKERMAEFNEKLEKIDGNTTR